MGLASKFDSLMQTQLGASAAWLPFAHSYQPGDYGLISGGVFQRIGNLADLGILVSTKAGTPVSLDLTSHAELSARFQAGAEVPAFTQNGGSGKLEFEFTRNDGFVLKAKEVTPTELTSLDAVAQAWFDHARYSRRIRIVSTVYTAKQALLLASSEQGTKLELSGEVDLLASAEAGVTAGVGLSVSSNKELALSVVGESGPVALKLFRVRILGGVAFRNAKDAQQGYEIERFDPAAVPSNDV
ncbi:MAG: hypothetical protein MUE69_13430 [Myxococcota bacterium]|jgi:hypothetical protein|nr:hypothetical protein [Myxococcota bacterium]